MTDIADIITTPTTTLADILRIPWALRAVRPRDAARLACACRALRDAVAADEHYWCASLGEDFGATDAGVPLAPSPLAGAPPDPPPTAAAGNARPSPSPSPPSWRLAYGRWARAFPSPHHLENKSTRRENIHIAHAFLCDTNKRAFSLAHARRARPSF